MSSCTNYARSFLERTWANARWISSIFLVGSNLSATSECDNHCVFSKSSSAAWMLIFSAPISHGGTRCKSLLDVISEVPPTSVATTVHRDSNASITVVGSPSWKLGFTNMSVSGSICHKTSFLSRKPKNSMWSQRSCEMVSCSSSFRISPSHTMRHAKFSTHSLRSLPSASIRHWTPLR